MDTTQFVHWLRIGLGRPIVYLRDHDSQPYRDTILNACLQDTVYDRQCEGSRAPYLFDVIAATGEPDYYRDRLLAASAPEALDGYDGEQILALLGHFAAQGDAVSRAQLYHVFDANIMTERPDGATEIVEVDGVTGLLTIVGRLVFDPEDDWEAYSFVRDAIARSGEAETWSALRIAAATDPPMLDFYTLAQRGRDQYESPALTDREAAPTEDYATLRAQLLAGDRSARRQFQRWAIRAADDELRLAAVDVLTENDPKRLEVLLSLFRKRPFPLEHARLLTLARSTDRRIAALSRTILANLTHPDVRALGLALLAKGDGDGARLLANNYQEGDFTLIERLLLTWTDRHEIHNLGFGLRHLAEPQQRPEAIDALSAAYERGPCSLCREHSVELLAAVQTLPAWLVAECQHDANKHLRGMAREYAAQGNDEGTVQTT
jgi:hypothetical protein